MEIWLEAYRKTLFHNRSIVVIFFIETLSPGTSDSWMEEGKTSRHFCDSRLEDAHRVGF